MTDRELLQLAAKAAGIPLQLSLGSTERNWAFFVANGGPCAPWNPLTDDGDAFRLAVRLRLNTTFTRGLGAGHGIEYMQVVPSTLGHLAEFGQMELDEAVAGEDGGIQAALPVLHPREVGVPQCQLAGWNAA